MSFKQERWLQIRWKLPCLLVFESWMISVINRVLRKVKARQKKQLRQRDISRMNNMLLKYHAEEERWQNLICSDLKHYATHFWLFVCLFNVCKVRYKIHTIPFTGTQKPDTEKGKMSVQGVKLRLIQAPMRLNFSL